MSEITRLLWVRLFMYAAWLSLAAGAVALIDPETDSSVFGIALLATIAGLGIARPFRGSHLLLAAAGALAYAVLQGLRASAVDADPDATYLPAAAVGAAAFALTAIVADQLHGSLRNYDEELQARQLMIEELETLDSATGTVKREHAQRMISAEVERARRYHRSVTLVVVGPDDWEDIATERSPEESEELIASAGRAYLDLVRVMDQVIHLEGPEFAMLLPETELEGAQVVAEKACGIAAELFGAESRAGIATFPEDQVTGAGLMGEAEEAFAFARSAHITVASRALLS